MVNWLATLQPKFVEDLNLLSRVLHMLQAPSIEDGFGILIALKKKYDEGGVKRQRHTLIPLTFKALRLIQDIRKQQASVRPVTYSRSIDHVLILLQ